jgi:G:T/U-mismatch repair DNA glycosylase
MPVLHEILAVESDKEKLFQSTLRELIDLFTKKIDRFNGHETTLRLFAAEDGVDVQSLEAAEAQHKALETTVPNELEYLAKIASNYMDIVYQKEMANQKAEADLIVDGKVLVANVPATTLLGLETKLKQLRTVLVELPTLQPGVHWERDSSVGRFAFRDKNPEIRAKTRKDFASRILVQPTDHHPAQIEKWTVDREIGHFTKIRWSGCISVAEKSALLERFDKLLDGVKQARQRANTQIVNSDKRIGAALFDYLLAPYRTAGE